MLSIVGSSICCTKDPPPAAFRLALNIENAANPASVSTMPATTMGVKREPKNMAVTTMAKRRREQFRAACVTSETLERIWEVRGRESVSVFCVRVAGYKGYSRDSRLWMLGCTSCG